MKRYILTLLAVLTLTIAVAVPANTVYANSVDSAVDPICESIRVNANSTCGSGANTIETIIRGVLNILSLIAGVAAVIMIVLSGFKYITSNGDSNAIGAAKRTLLYAIIGLIIAAMAQFIVRFVLRYITP